MAAPCDALGRFTADALAVLAEAGGPAAGAGSSAAAEAAAAASSGNSSTIQERERKLNEMIMQLQVIREHLLNQVSYIINIVLYINVICKE